MKAFVQILIVVVALFPALAVNGATPRNEQEFLAQLDNADQALYHSAKSKLVVAANSTKKKNQTKASAAVDFPGFPGLGSVENAFNLYAVPRSRYLVMNIDQQTVNGRVKVKEQLMDTLAFSTRSEMEEHFQSRLRFMAEGALTHPGVDKDKPFRIFAFTTSAYETIGWVNYLFLIRDFNLVKSSDGSYGLPDFSSYKLGLVTTMVYELPNVKWVRATATYNPAFTTQRGTQVWDSRLMASGDSSVGFGLDRGSEWIEIKTDLATRGTNGITIFGITLQRWDEDHIFAYGSYDEQLPFMTGFKIVDGQVSFNVTGSRNQTLQVDSSPSIDGPWIVAGSLAIPYDTAYACFKGSLCGPNGFYRVRAVTDE